LVCDIMFVRKKNYDFGFIKMDVGIWYFYIKIGMVNKVWQIILRIKFDCKLF